MTAAGLNVPNGRSLMDGSVIARTPAGLYDDDDDDEDDDEEEGFDCNEGLPGTTTVACWDEKEQEEEEEDDDEEESRTSC